MDNNSPPFANYLRDKDEIASFANSAAKRRDELRRPHRGLSCVQEPGQGQCDPVRVAHRRAPGRGPRRELGSVRPRGRCLDETELAYQAKARAPRTALRAGAAAPGRDEGSRRSARRRGESETFAVSLSGRAGRPGGPWPPGRDHKGPWRAIRKLAGLSGVRVHDLRRSYASILASARLSLPVIGALLGHTQPGTTARYAHLFDDPLRAATERVGLIVAAAANGQSGEVVPLPQRKA